MNLFSKYLDIIKTSILELIKDKNIDVFDQSILNKIVLEVPRDFKNGDMSTNAALILASLLKLKPLIIADLITKKLSLISDFKDIKIAKPGFINFFLKNEIWHDMTFELLNNNSWKIENIGFNKNINLEFVSANPTGPLHAGHARGAIIGDALASILEVVGYKVTREYYINDAGNQIKLLVKSVYIRYLEQVNKKSIKISDGLYPGKYLIRIGKIIKNKFGDKLINLDFDDFYKKIKNVVINEILKLIKKDLSDLGIKMDTYTSETSIIQNGYLDKVLKKLEQKKLIYTGILDKPKGNTQISEWESKPQLLFKSSLYGDDSDRALKKSDGSWTYFANDIAYHLYKLEKTKGDLINILGADHSGYLLRLESAVKALSSGKVLLNNKVCSIVHLMDDGQKLKMSKRDGNFVKLSSMIKDIGKDVIRFIMLTRKNDQVLEFDFKKAKEQSKDNPVFYVHYAYARCKSILSKAKNIHKKEDFKNIKMINSTPELNLIKVISQWPKVVQLSAIHLEPHRITFYLINLASEFHSLWNRGKVDQSLKFLHYEDEKITKSKIALIHAVMLTLESGLKILSIKPMEKM